jgi:transposase
MATADHKGKLSGHLEIDETYHGPRTHKQGTHGKMVLMGMVERGPDGKIRTGVVPNSRIATFEGVILNNVEKGSRIDTDEHYGYRYLPLLGYEHQWVTHSDDEWVKGDAHTNTIEGHWGHFKRSIRGTHVHVSQKHLWKYACEFAYRRNMRGSHFAMFSRLLQGIALPRLATP